MRIAFIIVLVSICLLFSIPLLVNPQLEAYLISVDRPHDFSVLELLLTWNHKFPKVEGLQARVLEGALVVRYTFQVINNSRMDVHGYGIFSPQVKKQAKWAASTIDIAGCPLFISQGVTSIFEIWCEFEEEDDYLACKLSDFVVYSAHSHTNPSMVETRKFPRAVYSLIGFGFSHVKNIYSRRTPESELRISSMMNGEL